MKHSLFKILKMSFIFLYVCLQAHVCSHPGRSEEGVGCLGPGVTGSRELQHCGCWEENSGPLQEI